MERKRIQKVFTKPSLTRQEFKDECDLELTVKRFAKTPEGRNALSNVQGYLADVRFDDVSDVPDFRTARDYVLSANVKFMALPAILRKRFDNDPAQFLDFALDPKNLDEMRKLGLCNPAPQDAVTNQASSTPGT